MPSLALIALLSSMLIPPSSFTRRLSLSSLSLPLPRSLSLLSLSLHRDSHVAKPQTIMDYSLLWTEGKDFIVRMLALAKLYLSRQLCLRPENTQQAIFVRIDCSMPNFLVCFYMAALRSTACPRSMKFDGCPVMRSSI